MTYSLNNSTFGDVVDRIYPIAHEIQGTADTTRSTSYLDLHLAIHRDGRIKKKCYYNFPIVNFPFKFSNIPASHAYGVYISQLIRYSRACGYYRGLLLTRKLLNQGFLYAKLNYSLNRSTKL